MPWTGFNKAFLALCRGSGEPGFEMAASLSQDMLALLLETLLGLAFPPTASAADSDSAVAARFALQILVWP